MGKLCSQVNSAAHGAWLNQYELKYMNELLDKEVLIHLSHFIDGFRTWLRYNLNFPNALKQSAYVWRHETFG